MGFDSGLMLANLLFAYFSQPGHKNDDQFSAWILNQTILLFDKFEKKFESLWRAKEVETSGSGDCSQAELLRVCPAPASPLSAAHKESFLRDVWSDALGFAGAELIRRIVGIAHVEDLDGIENVELRAVCEKRCLWFARHCLLQATDSRYEAVAVLPLVATPRSLQQAVEAMNQVDVASLVWPE
jgi:5-methylthioribose kinase